MTPQEPAMGVSEEVRTQFEAWVSAPPFEYSVARWPVSGASAWPGNYRDLHVQLAWEAWQAALPHMQPAGEAVGALRDALADMLSGWRYIRLHYGDLGGVGWDRAEQKAAEALATPPRPSAEPQQEAQGAEESPPCSTHPDAPHGFDRTSSHSLDRYVCECEGWTPPATQPAPVDVRNLLRRFHSDTSGLPEEWQDWRNDFMRAIAALLSAQQFIDTQRKSPQVRQKIIAYQYHNTLTFAEEADDFMQNEGTALVSALDAQQPSADARDADEERLLGPREEHFGRAYIDASCAEGVWTHPDHVFEFIEKRARELHEAAIAAQREAGEG